MPKRLILCDCLGSQSLDSKALSHAAGVECSKVHTALCTDQVADAATEIERGDAVIACRQERARFADLAAGIGAPEPEFVDLRDRAGWSSDEAATTPKMAALVAEALLPRPRDKTVDVASEGLCLVVGAGDAALGAAAQLADHLSVTLLLTDDTDPPPDPGFDVIRGRIRSAAGAFGGFRLTLDALQQRIPGGRGTPGFGPPRDNGRTECDVILDLSGADPLFPAPDKRDGYLRADPGHPPAVARAVMAASHLSGTFEKTLHVRIEPALCAHSRAEQVACTKCLDICPASAITPAGEHVSIDPGICAGCGSCAAVCPSGAITYDAPPVADLLRRITTLADTYRGAGGRDPVLLVCDDAHGSEMIGLAARFGDGLPADVIPVEVTALAGFGHAEMLAALAAGFASVAILHAPTTETEALDRELVLARTIAPEGSLHMLDVADPEDLPGVLRDMDRRGAIADPALPMGTRRQVARTSATALAGDAVLPLPEGAPYGAVLVDTDACTLCLSCVSLCPSGALGDNPDMPQLRFQEDACLQCGLCANICPEDAITLEPRFDLTPRALDQRVLHEEEPFACIECGALFGVKSTVERIVEKLAGNHAMFANPDAVNMIRMCDNCRVNAQFKRADNPFQGGEKPRTRTTEDYLSKRRDH